MDSPVSLDDLLAATSACILTPKHFFVSWNGVLTLVYSGFPPAITRLKGEIAACFPGLPKENPGSLWPKTSLAALKDKQRLTPNQLKELNSICKSYSGKLASINASEIQVVVNDLSVVLYECRSLEKQISKKTVGLISPVDAQEPAADQLAKVSQVVSEAENEDYWFFASKDGSRAGHYQDVGLGSTLVHELKLTSKEKKEGHLAGILREFKARVETDFPGLYSWFSEGSLHCTIKGLTG